MCDFVVFNNYVWIVPFIELKQIDKHFKKLSQIRLGKAKNGHISLNGRIHTYMTTISKTMYVDNLPELVHEQNIIIDIVIKSEPGDFTGRIYQLYS